jgi:hypothetical protein
MRGSTPDVVHTDGQMIVEARTAQEALARVTDELGTRARIVAVDRVVRGGLAGFFARELVKVVAEAESADPDLDDAWGGEGLVRLLSDEMVTASLAEPRVADMEDQDEDPGDAGPVDVRDEGVDAGPVDLRIDRKPTAPSTPRRATASPATAALDRLMAQRLDQQTFGEALRRELERNGWKPADDPKDPDLHRALTALTDHSEAGGHGESGAQVAPAARVSADSAGVQESSGNQGAAHTSVLATADDAEPWISYLPAHEERVILLDEAPGGEDDPVVELEPWQAEIISSADAAVVVGQDVGEDMFDWGAALARVGLPQTICDAATRAHPGDEDGVVLALAEALAPLCRPLPHGDAALIGAGAAAIAEETGMPTATVDGAFHPGGDVCIPVEASRAGRRALAWLRDGRWLNVLVGEGAWEPFLLDDPAVVTALQPSDLPLAVTVASEHGLALGPITVGAGRREPADPAVLARAVCTLARRA